MRPDKTKSQIQAINHTAAMAKMYPTEIQNCVFNSRVYTKYSKFNDIPSNENTVSQKLVKMDSVEAGKVMSREGKVCILNFASYKHPGGGFITGSIAQEECLCHESILYNVLSSNNLKPFYEYNLNHLNGGSYEDRAIYTPDVLFVDDNNLPKFKADVLTCASPNYGYYIAQRVSKEKNYKALESRINFVKKILLDNNVDIAILGAYGCGVFHQDPFVVAKLFSDSFTKDNGNLKKVYYAIPGGHNYFAFERTIRCYN